MARLGGARARHARDAGRKALVSANLLFLSDTPLSAPAKTAPQEGTGRIHVLLQHACASRHL